MKKLCRYLLLCLLFACGESYSPDIKSALKLAGDNRQELEAVLVHYGKNPADSLKLRAAEFLISNMSAHFYRAEKTELHEAIDSLNREYKQNHLKDFDIYWTKYDSLKTAVHISPVEVFHDINSLKADFLINHIDNIFAAFEHSPWKQKTPFNDFCEYLLPYNLSREKRELWSKVYKKLNEPLFTDVFKQYKEQGTTLCEVFNLLRDSIKVKEEIILFPDFNWINGIPPTFLKNALWGNCEHNTFHLTYILRAAGIPVTVDYAPQWGTYNQGHSWNVIINETGERIPCDIWTNAGKWKNDVRIDLPKVYRYIYATDKNKESGTGDHFVPKLFTMNLRDVTNEYVPVADVTLVSKENPSYLCVFDNREWMPVAIAETEKDKAIFRNMGRKAVYFHAHYTGKKLQTKGFPFLLDSSGNISFSTISSNNIFTILF
ncbi:MAG: hypothetical protein LBS54_08520 [Dysgonamonadaceae bacterium]|jgi:hypothetical protein|nr:hypothetical protein [Dysgonamonadaceae bacterium]